MPRDIESIHFGHVDVEQDEVGPLRADQLQCGDAILRFADDLDSLCAEPR
jgi:hypothetical protein